MKRTSRLLATSIAGTVLAAALAGAWAQGTGSSGSTSGSGTGTGSGGGSAGSAAPTAPATQPGAGTRNTPQAKKIDRADRRFIEDAAASGMFELQAAQLAATKATDRAVKDYASTMADHHSAANRELMQLANSMGLELPPAPPRALRRELEQLGKKTGNQFDQEFVRKVGVEEHQKDVKRFQKASGDVKDPQLKAWIDKTLPSLQQHLAQAQKLPQAESSASRSAGGAGSSTSGAGPSSQGAGSNSGGGSGSGSGSAGGGNRTGN